MAATFGNLDLESLGVVGEPSVEYAKFETKVSEPDGYDGGVLANFRRGSTKIKFNLALDGDRAALVRKMNQLAAELGKGQQELVLPNMTQGFHFDAAANCVLQPVEYVDGFVLPLEFAVPDGCAVNRQSISIEHQGSIVVDSRQAVPWHVEMQGTAVLENYNPQIPGDGSAAIRLDIGDDHWSSALYFDLTSLGNRLEFGNVVVDSKTESFSASVISKSSAYSDAYFIPISTNVFATIDPGTYSVSLEMVFSRAGGRQPVPLNFAISWEDRTVW